MPAAFDADQLQRRFNQVNERFRRIEAQIAILSEKAGVPWEEPAEAAPPDVVALAQAGQTMDAIRRYRELTNADLAQAQAVVAAL
jgi:ribosomal protein L7/L12